MLRKSMIALCAAASVVALTPNMALAGHGGGGGGGGGHGGGGFGGGHGGGFGGGGSFGAARAGGFGGGNFAARSVSSGNFNSFARAAPAGVAAVAAPSGRFASGQFSHGGFNHGFHHHHGRFFVGGVGYDDYWDYPDYAYDDSYYDNGNCYVVQRRVHTPYGWRIRPVQVCG